MTAPASLYITPFYTNPDQNNKDKAQLHQDAGFAYDCAWSGDYATASDILQDWAVNNKQVSNDEAKWEMTMTGHLFLESYLLIGAELHEFETWVQNVFLPCCKPFQDHNTNQGAFALLARSLANTVLKKDHAAYISRYSQIISTATDSEGKLVNEIKRTNSGMWYSYLFLAPLVRLAQILPVEKYQLRPSLDWLFQYIKNPDSWPYRLAPKWTPLGIWQRIVYPCSPTLDLPRTDDWPANLYYVAGRIFGRQDWQTWGNPPPYWTYIFRRG